MVHEGYRFALPPILLGLLALTAGWSGIGTALLAVGGFVLFFFRDPARRIPDDPMAIVAPADGRVMEIVEEDEQGRPGRRMSIFLSIFDVHVNRVPYAGRIVRIQYRPGKFLNAMRARASLENEQNLVLLETPQGPVVVKQIAGFLARRVRCWKREGDRVQTGEKLGMIRFGSRVDLWLPAGARFTVRPGEHVHGGATIVARWD
ncbi:MAG: phosphatidylserine decarboxylase family protein [Firmicutes bacterium]|nr:phosphatidylserine decarboxylase family protein [Bacillota bacterium]